MLYFRWKNYFFIIFSLFRSFMVLPGKFCLPFCLSATTVLEAEDDWESPRMYIFQWLSVIYLFGFSLLLDLEPLSKNNTRIIEQIVTQANRFLWEGFRSLENQFKILFPLKDVDLILIFFKEWLCLETNSSVKRVTCAEIYFEIY